MTPHEQEKLINVISHCLSTPGMLEADAICYGRHLEEIIKAIPSDIRESYNAGVRKRKADELRAKADKIEKGEDKD